MPATSAPPQPDPTPPDGAYADPPPHRLSTIVLMPATSAPTKRSTTSHYGAYADPRREEPE